MRGHLISPQVVGVLANLVVVSCRRRRPRTTLKNFEKALTFPRLDSPGPPRSVEKERI
jgi:hypothetical protein